MADAKKDTTYDTAGTLRRRIEPGEARGNCAILAAPAQLIVDGRNAIKAPSPHEFRLASPRPQALEAEPLKAVDSVDLWNP